MLPLFGYSIKVSSVNQLTMVVEWHGCETLELLERESESFFYNPLSAHSPFDTSRAVAFPQEITRGLAGRLRTLWGGGGGVGGGGGGGKGKVSWSC